jgi:hypothetical protein
MSIIVERLDSAIMRGDINTPAWVVNTMRAAREHIAKLEAHVTTDNSAVIATLEDRIKVLEETCKARYIDGHLAASIELMGRISLLEDGIRWHRDSFTSQDDHTEEDLVLWALLQEDKPQ